MTKAKKNVREHVVHHRDGSIWARGEKTADGVLTGYWEWFRKDGTKMRSGYFEDGKQAGEWTTCDRKGKVVKVTVMKPKKLAASKKVKSAKAKKAAITKATSRKAALKKVKKPKK